MEEPAAFFLKSHPLASLSAPSITVAVRGSERPVGRATALHALGTALLVGPMLPQKLPRLLQPFPQVWEGRCMSPDLGAYAFLVCSEPQLLPLRPQGAFLAAVETAALQWAARADYGGVRQEEKSPGASLDRGHQTPEPRSRVWFAFFLTHEPEQSSLATSPPGHVLTSCQDLVATN